MGMAGVFVLAGCLSKPGPPGVIDAMGDGSVDTPSDMAIDTPPACQGPGAALFPSDFVPERTARIIDLDRNGTDDVLVFGRIGALPNIQVRGYVVLGRSPMVLDCYDFSFTPSQDGDLLDVWVGKVTNDNLDDVGVLTKRGQEYLLDLYEGRVDPNGGLVFPPHSRVVANTMFGLNDNLGGSPSARSPVFVTGFRNGSFAGLAFGGTSQPWVVAPFTGTGFNAMVQVGDIGAGAQFPALQPAEQVWAHAFGAPNNELLVVTTAGELRVLTHDSTDGTAARFALPSTPAAVNTTVDGGGGNRTVRAWHRALASGTTSIAAMEGAAGNIAIVRYRTFASPDYGFASEYIEAAAAFAAGYTTVYDFGFGTLDGNAADPIDVVALTGTPGTARRLSIHRNLDFTTVVAGEISVAAAPISTMSTVAGGTLAIGKFDPAAGAKDQILVLRPPAGGPLGTCYEVIDQTTSPCIATCGSTTCL
jgi:hypothetical protein